MSFKNFQKMSKMTFFLKKHVKKKVQKKKCQKNVQNIFSKSLQFFFSKKNYQKNIFQKKGKMFDKC